MNTETADALCSFRVKINKDSNMRKVTTCYGEFHIENDIAISSADNSRRLTLPFPKMTNDEIKDYFRILWENEHPYDETETPVRVYLTVSLDLKRKDRTPLTNEDIQEIISQCDYSFTHKDVDIETEICGINEY